MAFQDKKFMELVCGLVVNEFGDDVRFVQSADGLDATTKLNFQSFHCVILESAMNKKSCVSVASSIRNSALNSKVPILISTEPEDIKTQLSLEKIPFIYVVSKKEGATALVNLILDQLKLNVHERRLSALMLNTITDGFTQFIESTTDVNLKVQPAKLGEFKDFCTNQSVLIEIQHEWSNAEIYVNLNDQAITILKDKFPFLKNLNYDQVRKSFSSFILRKCLQELSNKKTLKTKVGLVDPETLMEFSHLKGIVMTLVDKTDFEITIFVLPPRA